MGRRILIVEDETDICEILKEVLVEGGYDVDVVHSGEEGLEYLTNVPYDALIVDVRLSGSTSGIDIIKTYRAVQNRPKIIVMSATAKRFLGPTLEDHAVSDLVDKVLEKPGDLNPERFVNEINIVLGR
ncbi:MAG: response regulator [Candidatus Omnitrophota bacterium]|nr:response regulator [Candidatus Omnitrophota bacterium]